MGEGRTFHDVIWSGMDLICTITRWLASSAVSDQSIPAVGFAAKRMNNRTVSAPYSSIISSGETVFPSDLLILADLEPSSVLQWGHGLPS